MAHNFLFHNIISFSAALHNRTLQNTSKTLLALRWGWKIDDGEGNLIAALFINYFPTMKYLMSLFNFDITFVHLMMTASGVEVVSARVEKNEGKFSSDFSFFFPPQPEAISS